MMHELDEQDYIRHKLFAGDDSPGRRYRRLVIGDGSLWEFLRYEILTSLLGSLPGASGLLLRKRFYPKLFGSAGRGVVFGRHLVLRNPQNIRLGEEVIIDDHCVIAARGAGEEGLVIEDRVILNRGVHIQAKVGPVRIGAESDIGAGSCIIAQGGVSVGRHVAMGGGCKVGGGLIETSLSDPGAARPDVGGRTKVTRGPVRIEDRVTLGTMVIILDGATVGTDCIVGAGVVIREDVPPRTIVAPRQRLVMLPRPAGRSSADVAPEPKPKPARSRAPQRPEPPGELTEVEVDPRTVRAIFAAIEEVNLQLPPEKRLPRSLDTPLYGNGGGLDSLILVNLLVASEDRLAEEFGSPISLTDRDLASRSDNPLATVGSLVRFVEQIQRNG